MRFWKNLKTRIAIFRLVREARRLAAKHGVRATAFHIGAYWIHPRHLAIWLCVDADEQKRRLKNDAAFMAELRGAPAAASYPAEGRDFVGFEIESQETVDRDFEGNWFYRVK